MSSREYTPSNGDVREAAAWGLVGDLEDNYEAFDRWLAKHDAEVLRQAADAIGHAANCHADPDRDPYVGCKCRLSGIYARADRIHPTTNPLKTTKEN